MPWTAPWVFGLILLLRTAAVAGAEPGFDIERADTRLADDVYLLDAEVDYRFSDEALDALESGVPLTVSLDIEVQRKRGWYWFDADVASLEQRYRLQHHALSNQYLVLNENSGAWYAYPTRDSALDALGRIRGLPVIDSHFLDPHEEYEVELRVRLDIEALPAPLRPIAYVTPAWRLGSDWYAWSLQR